MADRREERAAAATPRAKRRKAALDSRIVASGIAACALFGMVVGMGLAGPADPRVAATPARQQPEVVVIRQRIVPTGDGGSVEIPAPVVVPAPAPTPSPPPTASGGS